MSERTRLTLAVALTCLLLAAVGVAGIVLHTGSTAPAARMPVPIATQAAHPAPTPTWDGEHD